jgi:amino acid adenylation domain-containing protein
MNDLLTRIAKLSPEKRKLLELRTGGTVKASPMQRKPRSGPLPLSFAQEGVWFLERLEPGAAVYNTFQAIKFHGFLDIAGLRWALSEVMRRHEVLRTSFPLEDGRPCQRISEPTEMPLPMVDVGQVREEFARRLARQEAVRPFELEKGPVWRAVLLRLGQEDYALLLTIHHIASDGWSLGVLVSEFTELYAAWCERRPQRLPELPIQYADFAIWERQWFHGEVLDRQLLYWEQKLRGIVPLELPTDHPRPVLATHEGAVHRFKIESRTAAALRDLSQREGATLYMTLMAAFGVLLARYCGQPDIVIGSPVSNRSRLESEKLIGFFVNSLVLSFRVDPDQTFQQLLTRVREETLEAYENQDSPFAKVVERLSPDRDISRAPLFQIEFVFRNAPFSHRDLPGVQMQLWQGSHDRARFDLTLALADEGRDGLAGSFEYATDLFDSATMERMARHYCQLLRRLTQHKNQSLRRISLLDDEERTQVLDSWNATTHPVAWKPLPDLLDEQFEKTPDAIALVFEGDSVSYGELSARANRLAHFLIDEGLGPEDIVGVGLSRSVDLVVALLAVLKSGAAYLPLDPEYPAPRLEWLAQDARPALILTRLDDARSMPQKSRRCLRLDSPETLTALAGKMATNPGNGDRTTALSCDHPAYVIYTSGSTGTPKGVSCTHAGIVNRLLWGQQAYPLGPDDRVLQKTPFSFDVSLWEFLWPLLQGATLVVAAPGGHRDPKYLSRIIDAEGVTTIHFVPSMLDIFLQQYHLNCRSLRRVICSGEAVSPQLQAGFYSRFAVPLLNLYGPTEAAIEVSHWECRRDGDQRRVPIGRPIWNIRLYVLDDDMSPGPIGIANELYIGGVSLARGYLRRPALTAERFVPDPYGQPGSRMYRTGDMACWTPEGVVEYLGRSDSQTKIRGMRIELGEIEAALLRHPHVAQTAVLVREGESGDKKMVAYFTLRDAGSQIVDAEALRQYLSSELPEYMVPSMYVRLDSLPLTPSGKLERSALPSPGVEAFAVRLYEEPQGEVEKSLARLWQSVLNVPLIGRNDNFFALGGHSLMVLDLIYGMQSLGLQADVRALFTTPTLAALAASVSTELSGVKIPANGIPENCEAITPSMLTLVDLSAAQIEKIVATVPGGASNTQDIYPLAPMQEGILFHHLIDEGGGDPYLMSSLFSFDTHARLQAYLDAAQTVVDRHDILRTSVVWEGLPEPVQVVWRKARVAVEHVELDNTGDDAARQLYARFDPRQYRMNLCRAPLLHIYISQDQTTGRWLVMQLLHHLVDDYTALQVMKAEVETIMRGESDRLTQPTPFRDFIASSRNASNRDENAAFFREMLGDVEEPTAPFGLLNVQGDGSRIKEAQVELSAVLTGRIREGARRLAVSAASMCHAAWGLVLSHVSGQADVVFGTVLFGRMHSAAEANRAIGPFINTLPIRIRLCEEGVASIVRRTHLQLAELFRHEHASLVLARRCSAVPVRIPLFSALLNYRHTPVADRELAEEKSSAWAGVRGIYAEERTNYPVTLSIDDLPEGMVLTAQVDPSLDPVRICEYMTTCIESLVGALENAPATPAQQLNVLPESERGQVLGSWNDTHRDYTGKLGVQELFEAQAETQPDATAVIFGNQHVTYGALNRRANQLAHQLLGLGLRPDDRVGLCVDRSVELIVGLLGTLKAGTAYVPLDPEYPPDRLQFMLLDSRATVLLTQQRLAERLSIGDVQVVLLDQEARRPVGNPPVRAISQNLAYVIYTSGSTGLPKAVGVTHAGLVNYLAWAMDFYPVSGGRAALVHSSIGFDLTVTSIYPSLLQGRGIELAPITSGLDALAQSLQRYPQCNVLKLTPSHLRALHNEMRGTEINISSLVIGGEPLAYEILSPWRGKARLINEYGPTETVVGCCVYEVGETSEKEGWVPIGRPIANTQVYVLGEWLSPAPVGVAGELYIGGAGVARGYLNHPGLTAERFVPNPYSERPGARMYRTGDRAKWRADGNLEYLGRSDEQLKIRGYRIEPGEIEAALLSHPRVNGAAVAAHGEREEARLVGYVTVSQSEAERTQAQASAVQEWNRLYESVYAENSSTSMDFNLAGWTSAYTGQPIAVEEMILWVEESEARLRFLNPHRVLEIGCGTGLLLSRIAPQCEGYLGSDFSAEVLAQLGRYVNTRNDLSHVQLQQGSADDLSFVPDNSVDLVILNSVVQYFPDVDYLVRVLDGAVRVLRPGGSIYVGDVRSMPLLEAFHTSVLMHKAAADLPIPLFRQRISDAMGRERELVLSPELFEDFARRHQKLGAVHISPKAGNYDNELSRFRYDVVIRLGEKEEAAPPEQWIDWDESGRWRQTLKRGWASGSGLSLGLRAMPDRRVASAVRAASQLQKHMHDFADVSQLRAASVDAPGEDCHQVIDLARNHGKSVYWRGFTAAGTYDVVFSPVWRKVPALPQASAVHYRQYGRAPSSIGRDNELGPELQRHLRRTLPEYMVPSAILILDSLPTTRNEKIDRTALPKPELSCTSAWRAPRAPEEELLCGLFADVLGVERVGLDDNFFEAGGHSLTATSLVSRIRETLGVEVSLRTLFESSTVGTLAPRLSAARSDRPPLARQVRPSRLPLSYAQQRMLFINMLAGASPEYNISQALSLHGDLDCSLLQRTIDTIVDRHESLRTHFPAADGEAWQVVVPNMRVPLQLQDLSGSDEASQHNQVDIAMKVEQTEPFDLSTGPVLRLKLLRLGQRHHILLLTMHHIVSDGWSENVFNRELAVLYAAYRNGGENPLPPLSVQYADFALWQRQWLEAGAMEDGLRYWKQQLAGAPAQLELPADRPRPPVQTFAAGIAAATVPPETALGLKRLGRTANSTLYMSMVAAFSVLVWRYSGQDDIVVGSPIANRHDLQLEGMIGLFVNNLAVRIRLNAGMTFRQLLDQVHRTALDGYRHQEIPFERVVEELSPPRSLNSTPIYQILFALQNTPLQPQQLPVLEIHRVAQAQQSVRLDIEVHASEKQDGIRVEWLYNRDLFDHWRMDQMARHYVRVIEQAVANPDRALANLDLLEAVERRRILDDWNDARGPVEGDTLLGAFEEQASQSPDGIAVTLEDFSLSYGELNERANRLARLLIGLRVGPEAIVGFALPRSLEMIVANVAVLKAGAAYLPIEPHLPAERIAFMIEDARPSCILTTANLSASLPPAVPLVIVDDPEVAKALATGPGGDLTQEDRVAPFGGENTAYIMYTSGSTGKPKGVAVTHGSVANILQSVKAMVPVGKREVGTLFHSTGADIAVWEMWAPLVSGGRLVVIPLDVSRSPADVRDLLARERVTLFSQTPSALYQFIQADDDHARSGGSLALQSIVVGGEPLESRRLSAWRDRSSGTVPTVFNMYGPTEVTVWATAHRVTDADLADGAPLVVTIGRPLLNYAVYILDRKMEPVPPGVTGELYVAGVGLAREYRNRPGLTAEKFVAHPFSHTPGSRLYCTGDLVRWLPDGKIEFIGRADDQVKLRGYRIELGEVNAAVLQQPGVREATVVVREDEPGNKKLVAYVVADEKALSAAGFQAALRTILPEYMVPSEIVFLGTLPLSANGKLDRKALPKPQGLGRKSEGSREDPRDNTEAYVKQIWEEVLGVRDIGIRENFFDLGGHSMKAVVAVSRVSNVYGRRISVPQLFQYPTVEQFSAFLRRDVACEPTGTAVPIQTRGARPPLFCVHAAGGLAASYAQLARELGPEQPLYAFQSAGFEERRLLDVRIEDMAAEYIADLRKLRPTGPYQLAGWSLGGLIAYEMAQQLSSAGESVSMLALLDTTAFTSRRYSAGRGKNLVPIEASSMLNAAQQRCLVARLEAAKTSGKIPADITLSQFHRFRQVYARNARAGRVYYPAPYLGDGHIVLLRTRTDGADATQGWGRLAPGRVQLAMVPCRHDQMVFAPHVQLTAAILRDAMARTISAPHEAA